MNEPLRLSAADATDLRQAVAALHPLHDALEDWHTADILDRWQDTTPDVDRLHELARELARSLNRIRRRHATRLAARERRGSPLEG